MTDSIQSKMNADSIIIVNPRNIASYVCYLITLGQYTFALLFHFLTSNSINYPHNIWFLKIPFWILYLLITFRSLWSGNSLVFPVASSPSAVLSLHPSRLSSLFLNELLLPAFLCSVKIRRTNISTSRSRNSSTIGQYSSSCSWRSWCCLWTLHEAECSSWNFRYV